MGVVVRRGHLAHQSRGETSFAAACVVGSVPHDAGWSMRLGRSTTADPHSLGKSHCIVSSTPYGGGVGYGGRTDERVGRRNGYCRRDLGTRSGALDVVIPKLREGTCPISYWLLQRQRRAEAALTAVIPSRHSVSRACRNRRCPRGRRTSTARSRRSAPGLWMRALLVCRRRRAGAQGP